MDRKLALLLEARGLSPRGALRPLGGGDMAAVYWLETNQGAVVVKQDDAQRLAGDRRDRHGRPRTSVATEPRPTRSPVDELGPAGG